MKIYKFKYIVFLVIDFIITFFILFSITNYGGYINSVNASSIKTKNHDLYKKVYRGNDVRKVFKQYKGLKKYLYNIQKDKSADVAQIIKSDINKDGRDEFIVSFGRYYFKGKGEFRYNYIIKLSNNKYTLLSKINSNSGGIIHVDVVLLDNTNNRYIYVEEAAHGVGRIVYNFNNGKLSMIHKKFPPIVAGVANYELVEDKKTGIFKALDTIIYYDSQGHEVDEYYIWKKNKFISTTRKVTYAYNGKFSYPSNPENLIRSYLDALYLRFYSEEKMMQYDDKVGNINIHKYFSPHYEFEYEYEQLQYKKICNNKNVITYKVNNNDSRYALIQVIKKEKNWKIKNIKGF